ncbi:hypothetical protein ACKKBG_A24680 [Auxenochlorella protothecoides x Auxenochlorella symbiontica]
MVSLRSSLLAVLVVVALAIPALSHSDDFATDDDAPLFEFTANVTAAKSVPPIKSNTTAFFAASVANGTVTWELEVLHVQNLTMAHIHLGNSVTNGPIIVGLLPLGEPVDAFDGSVPPMFKHPRTGLRLAFNGTFTADDFVGPFAGLEMDDLIYSFYTEEVYVNIHTVRYPAGAARGQVNADPDV